MIKAIIFDLSEVYLRGLLGTHEILTKRLKKKIESTELLTKDTKKFFEGKMTEDEFWRTLRNKSKWDIRVKELKKIVRMNFGEIEGTREIIEKLKKRGYKLGLLSVHTREWVAHCEKRFDYHRLFHSIMYSFEAAVCKPERKAYELILEKINSEPGDCLFIDDNLENLVAAEKLGIKTIHFKSAVQLKRDLKKMGVKIK
ncbi:MAG: HAD family phosphatase [Parcubacteria group bacterium]|jgi:epoxide hydrolase-like predicted phosphatase